MFLHHLHISHFRNLQSVELSLPKHGYCVISGLNGSGKTSVLEAIYALSCGKSFRTTEFSQLIQNDAENFVLFAKLSDMNIGIQRDRHEKIIAKCNGEPVKFSDIARMLPTRIISPIESYTLINGGPEQRRRFLDWGMFHVKHFYWAELQKLHRIIKQKNAALKMRCSDDELMQWNHMLTEVSYSLDQLRQEYLQKFAPIFEKYREKLPSIQPVKLTYFPGWDKNSTDLFTQLSTVSKQEKQIGYCVLGPHRAEIRLETSHGLCKDQLSRGRQKTLAIALYLAQGELLFNEVGRHPLYMIDDFSSELDTEAQQLLINALDPSDKQVIITNLEQHHPVLNDTYIAKHAMYRYKINEGVLQLIDL